jgi:hypothetical protein
MNDGSNGAAATEPRPRRPARGRRADHRDQRISRSENRMTSFVGARPHVYVRVGAYEFCFIQMHASNEEEYDLDVGRFVIEYMAGEPTRVRSFYESDDLPDPVDGIYDLAFDALDSNRSYIRCQGIPGHLLQYITEMDNRVDQLQHRGRRRRSRP